MKPFRLAFAAVILPVAVLLPSCSHRAAPAVAREAFLAFDNLTGDAGLDWIAQAAPRILEHDFTGVPGAIPFTAATLQDAYSARASRLVEGYYEIRSGKLHFEIAVEDASEHRTVQTTSEDGDAPDALNRAAKRLTSAAHDFPATQGATEAWGKGDFERAVALDPGFALGWLSWIQKLASSGDAAQARSISERALSQPNLRPAVDLARLQLAAATLREDDNARIEASRKLTQLLPDDPSLVNVLAQEEMRARRFSDAARDLHAAAQSNPSDSSVLNSLGYAEALAGNLDAARQAFEKYGRGAAPAPINALDSMGEAYFLNGKFEEAARSFLDAYGRDPAFLQAATLWKAAHARWLAGDLPGADAIANRYFQDRSKAHDPLVVWRRATWLYETGRRQQAQSLLMNAPPEAAQAARQQLQVWNARSMSLNLEQLERSYRQSEPANDGMIRTFYAEALLRAGKKDEAKALLRLWPLPAANDSPLQSLVYAKFEELRKAAG